MATTTQEWLDEAPPGLTKEQVFTYYQTGPFKTDPNVPPLETFRQQYADREAEHAVKKIEAESDAAATADRRAKLRRRGGPTGAGATILTSPLGVPAPFQGQPATLLGLP